MKKIYDTPAMITNGSVVRETQDQIGGPLEPAGFQRVAGSVGFNL